MIPEPLWEGEATAETAIPSGGRQVYGVTIHFKGRLRRQSDFNEVIRIAESYARVRNWPTRKIELDEVRLSRVNDDEERVDYMGPVRGTILTPHPLSEEVRLEFDREYYIQEFCKTQYAGAAVHVAVVELLDSLSSFFSNLTVDDEGGYFELRDEAKLAKRLHADLEALREVLKEDRHARGPIRCQAWRVLIMDCYTGDIPEGCTELAVW